MTYTRNVAPEHDCPIDRALDVLGRRGALLIVRDLLEAPRRFGDLERSTMLPPRTLSGRLRELAATGVLRRSYFQEIPPRVEYSLTELGLRIKPLMDALRSWGEKLPPRALARREARPGNRPRP